MKITPGGACAPPGAQGSMSMQIDPYLKIIRYTHFFSVSEIKPSALKLVLDFSTRFVQKGFVREMGKNVLKPIKIFATRINSKNEFRFHIGQYSEFIKLLEFNGVSSDYYTIEDGKQS